MNLNDYDQAQVYFSESIKTFSTCAAAFNNLASYYHLKSNCILAKNNQEKAIQIKNTNYKYFYNLAIINKHSDNFDPAKNNLIRSQELNSYFLLTYTPLIQIYEKQGNTGKAFQVAKIAHKTFPQDLCICIQLSNLAWECKNVKLARDKYELAQSLPGNSINHPFIPEMFETLQIKFHGYLGDSTKNQNCINNNTNKSYVNTRTNKEKLIKSNQNFTTLDSDQININKNNNDDQNQKPFNNSSKILKKGGDQNVSQYNRLSNQEKDYYKLDSTQNFLKKRNPNDNKIDLNQTIKQLQVTASKLRQDLTDIQEQLKEIPTLKQRIKALEKEKEKNQPLFEYIKAIAWKNHLKKSKNKIDRKKKGQRILSSQPLYSEDPSLSNSLSEIEKLKKKKQQRDSSSDNNTDSSDNGSDTNTNSSDTRSDRNSESNFISLDNRSDNNTESSDTRSDRNSESNNRTHDNSDISNDLSGDSISESDYDKRKKKKKKWRKTRKRQKRKTQKKKKKKDYRKRKRKK
ncbi:hypothetical protein M0812_14648 [Anaeramoeba flamelloides]|uniref:Uncharacterized protein n=1 Tax=Anaeramoeba flamelloides TaxID=1746091 RepID=A0AAV7Z9C3_9EUKA|nr:hypothetical protein M0812_14648 [Anaeramoeba flamelloides]